MRCAARRYHREPTEEEQKAGIAQKVSAAHTERLTTESTRLADCMTDAMLVAPGAR